MGFILDTDILSLLWRNHEKVVARVIAVGAEPMAITLVTYIEVLRGRFASVFTAANAAELDLAADALAKSRKKLDELRVVEFNSSVSKRFDELRTNKRLKKMGRPDLLNACFALVYGATLVTRNTKDYANVPGLKLDNWAD